MSQLLWDRDDIYYFVTKCRSILIEQLQPDIVDFMHAEKVITEEEYAEIATFSTRENLIISILDLLPSRGLSQIQNFMDYLVKWYPWILSQNHKEIKCEESTHPEMDRILAEGEVPPLPLWHVSRNDEYIQLCDYLHKLRRGEYIVVHGMGGCGKSTLVIEALTRSKSLITDAFSSKVFWLTIGRESSAETLTVLQEFYGRLHFTARGYKPPNFPLDVKSAKQFLIDRLIQEEFSNCLLILDDVPSSSLIDSLNVGCKILVTTDNKQIMNGVRNKIHYIRVSEGFTEDETLKLFSDSLGCSELPTQAKHIHSLCKGFPMTVSLLASQLAEHREEVLCDNERWDVYVAKLRDKDLCAAIGRWDKHRHDQVTALYKALGMSIDSLEYPLKKYYNDFALFMDDLNIRPEVLCTLWDLSKKEVEDIMTVFEKKSLIIKTWNCHVLSYVYCIHDLLLVYLKREHSNSERQRLHQKLINKYKQKYGDFIDFPKTDNYIYLYLGYHLKEAGYLHEFPRLYLDLRFIEAKILTHGPADVLYDFRKYKSYIQTSENNIKKYEDMQHFIRRIGICRTLTGSDIVQFGLTEAKESYVYTMAKQLANSSKKKYLEFLTEAPEENTPPFVYCREKITAAIFTSSDNNLLIANDKHEIKLVQVIDHLKVHTLATFRGHKERVSQLQLSTCALSYFLSASDDSTVRVWYLNDLATMQQNTDKPRTPSPQLMQSNWWDPWEKQRYSGESEVALLNKHRLPITHATFANKSFLIATAAQDRLVIIWNFTMELKPPNMGLRACGNMPIQTSAVVESCGFSNNDDILLCASHDGVIFMYKTSTGQHMSSVSTGYPIKSISIVPETPQIDVLILGENYFYVLDKLDEYVNSLPLENKLNHKHVERKREDNYICAAISRDGKHVAIASTNYTIVVREVKSGEEVQKFIETNGTICGLDWSFANTALVAAYANTIAKVWTVQNVISSKKAELRHSMFDAAWITSSTDEEEEEEEGDEFTVTAALDYNNIINVFYNEGPKQVLENQSKLESDIGHLCVSPFDGHIVYACKDGSAYLTKLDDWKSYKVLDVECVHVCRLKVFGDGKSILITLLVERTEDEYAVLGTLRSSAKLEDEKESGEIGQFTLDANGVHDFNADLKKDSLYVIGKDHVSKIYDCQNGSLRFTESINNESIRLNEVVRFCDFSAKFAWVASGNRKEVFLRTLNHEKKKIWRFDDAEEDSLTPSTCKFSYDEKYLAVGFKQGVVKVYNVENFSVTQICDDRGQVIDIVWSPCNYRLLLVLDREIIIFGDSFQNKDIVSELYMKVDQILCNNSFNRFITVDHGGHLHVFKYPL